MAIYGTKSAEAVDYSKIDVDAELQRIRSRAVARNPHEKEFIQAFDEIVETLIPLFKAEPKYLAALEAVSEPERVLQFRVPWFDEQGNLQVNRGFRVEYNSAIGPYKGGLRFHPTVNLGVLKFLGFEQIFKNSLTGLPMGGGKGGSDFDPKGKSDLEVRAFCQSFMTELARHIGPDTDVPAGDIGVGAREIGFLYGQYRKIRNENTGVLTGKGFNWGGSRVRPEATGYGAVYFAQSLFKDMGKSLEGMTALVSGSGNAAQYCAQKLIQLGAKVLTLSDSNGTVVFEKGMTKEDLEAVFHLKNVARGRLSDLKTTNCVYHANSKPWGFKAQVAFPAATQNEINGEEAKQLAANGCLAVVEVANMPSTPDAIKIYKDNGVRYCPGKAANAGGVAVSGLEMAQNSMRTSWTFEEVDNKLKGIMDHIYNECVAAAKKFGTADDLQLGANIAGFVKVADSMFDQGLY